MANMRVNKTPIDAQKKFDISGKIVIDLLDWNEHDITAHFQIQIQEIQRGWKKLVKLTRSGRQLG
jgi:uncharacterized protein with von Willebrand factor type A (vWA) domain